MNVEECQNFEKCSAALCPLEKKHLKIGLWYSDEEICCSHRYGWIKNQRKIAKKTKDRNRYFTYEMLKVKCRIAKGILGLDPDKPEAPQLVKWFENHPPIKELTEAQKKVITDRFAKYRKKTKKK